jgi:hypothetical protein
MGPLSDMRSVVGCNLVMWRIPVSEWSDSWPSWSILAERTAVSTEQNGGWTQVLRLLSSLKCELIHFMKYFGIFCTIMKMARYGVSVSNLKPLNTSTTFSLQ